MEELSSFLSATQGIETGQAIILGALILGFVWLLK